MKLNTVIIIGMSVLFTACFSVKYSFSGASIPAEMKTVSVDFFPNRAPIINPNLSQTFTEALKEKFRSQTKLILMSDMGDAMFEGEITDYTTTPIAVTSNLAAKTRFSIAVKVKYTNNIDPKSNFEQTFTRYEDFDAALSFSSVEDQLMKKIIEVLTEDIFNKAFANW